MDMRREDIERWLTSEDRGDDQAAESAFASLLAAVPRIEPHPGFVERIQAAAWRARPRHPVMARAARAAALLLGVMGSVAASGLALFSVGPALLVSGAGVASRSLGGILAGAVTGIEWWATGARMAVVVGETFSRREAAGVLLGVEVVGVLAFFVLHHLTRSAAANGGWQEVRT